MKYLVVHYSEIGTKGKNRAFFEKKLAANIEKKIKVQKVIRDYGQFILVVEEFGEFEREQVRKIPGIASVVVCEKVEPEVRNMCEKAVDLLKDESFTTFKIETARHHKDFPLTSQEINIQVGAFVVERLGRKVQLEHPEKTVYIEVCTQGVFMGLEKLRGLGGLPVGTGGKVVSLLSGGIDSPVASYLRMTRGCEVVLVHFENETINKGGVEDKIVQLREVLSEYQSSTTLYIIKFGELQREIITLCPSELRMLVYRYFMLRIASTLAEKEGALSLVTGDNLLQVASQTLENINALYPLIDKVVLSPLMGFSKQDIITLARKIGTYDISILPYGDCCSFLVAEHPELRATREKLQEIIQRFDVDALVKKALEKVEVIRGLKCERVEKL